MNYRIEKREAIRFVGAYTSLVNDPAQNLTLCPAFWRSCESDGMLKRLVGLEEEPAKRIYGISDYRNPDDARYYIAVETAMEAQDGLEVLELPAGEWAGFICNGHFPQTVQDAYNRFYTEWLPFSGYQAAQTADLECYPVTDSLMQDGKYELWIAVEREK